MKTISAIALCVLVVILHQMETSLAFEFDTAEANWKPYCAARTCPRGTVLHRPACKCTGVTSSRSGCPSGFVRVTLPDRQCICRRTTKPTCNWGFSLHTGKCLCTISRRPSCPSGSSLSPSTALCTGTAKPKCPKLAHMPSGKCSCVQDVIPTCSSRSRLSSDCCTCSTTTSVRPTCPTRACSLNWKTCTCTGGIIGPTIGPIFERERQPVEAYEEEFVPGEVYSEDFSPDEVDTEEFVPDEFVSEEFVPEEVDPEEFDPADIYRDENDFEDFDANIFE